VLPLLPRGRSTLKPPPPSPLPGVLDEPWLSFPFPDASFLVDAKASLNRPTGDGLRLTEEGAPRVCDFIGSGLPTSESGIGGTGGVSESTGSTEIKGEDSVR
jgi:hypothetical protein